MKVDSARASRDSAAFLAGGGEMGRRMREFDWTRTPLGRPETWSQSLKTATRIMLTSRQPIWIGWGAELIYLYNDPYKAIIGGKHPAALGQPTSAVWREIWGDIDPMLQTAMKGDEGTYVEAQLLIMERNGYAEETYYTFSYSPIPGDDGNAGGIICANTDDTQRVIGERQLALLRDLAAGTTEARTWREACARSVGRLEADPRDIPFAILYMAADDGRCVDLIGMRGLGVLPSGLSETMLLSEPSPWPLREVLQHRAAVAVGGLERLFDGPVPAGPWHQPPAQAAALPIHASGLARNGVLIVGLNPFRPFDGAYRSFLDLVVNQIAANVANAEAYEAEKARAESLAELDRAKTAFFSNISHEFRTPLTLVLGPLEDMLAEEDASPAHRERVEIVHRSALRLLKLVNGLLEFSRIEAGRVQASYRPVDLAALTADLASNFRAACERAGLTLRVDCPPLDQPVFVDREMWEKIVLNLISNAFKFTFAGEIAVTLAPRGSDAVLRVSDTGVGIPADELSRVFERFHRIESTRGRTYEGSGIGLALVQELVKLHGGGITVESTLGKGTTFTVAMPLGTEHLPADRLSAGPPPAPASTVADAFVTEALRLLPSPEPGAPPAELLPAGAAATTRRRIVVADDNADMRDYIAGLLSGSYEVQTFADGAAAVEAARAHRPDLILTDVMMPRLDGFGVVRELHADAATRSIPIIMLSARAGEESRIEGLAAGADDYMVKPFSAKELLARVSARLEIAELRRQATESLRRRAEQFETLLNQAPMGVYLIDADFRIRAVNPVALPVFASIEGGALGRDFGEVIHLLWENTYADEIVAIFRRTLETGEPYVAAESSEYRIDLQRTEYYEWRIDRITLPDGRYGIVCYFRDISVQVLARRAIEDSREALRDADRRKDEFLATLSHELRTPLNAIVGWAHMLQMPDLDGATRRRALDTIVRNAELQTQLIADILDVSRIITGKLSLNVESVSLPRLVGGVVDTLRPAAEAKNVALTPRIDDEADLILGDPIRLQQIVWNLLSNAVKFSAPGGQVELWILDDESNARLVVEDRGPGIDPDFLPYMFDRFRQANSSSSRAHGGLGLGLAIVRHLVELHGGSVEAHNRPGGGASFAVTLPRKRVARPAGATPARSDDLPPWVDEAPSLEGIRVLAIDDDLASREIVSLVLSRCGAEVRLAESAAEGLDIVQHERPTVVLADIEMPGQDGYTFIQKMRELPPTSGGLTPAAALTEYVSPADRFRVLEAGFQMHASKPIKPAELARVVAALAGVSREPSAVVSRRGT